MLDLLFSLSLLYMGLALTHSPGSRHLNHLANAFPQRMRVVTHIAALACIGWGYAEWPAPFGPILAYCTASSALLVLGSFYAILKPLFPRITWTIAPMSLGAATTWKVVGEFT